MKRQPIKLIILVQVCLLCMLCSCSSGNVQKTNTFLNLLKITPFDSTNSSNYVLIDYSKIWNDANIHFPINDHSSTVRDKIVNILKSLTYHFPGDDAFVFSSFYSGMDGTVKITPISYDTLGYDPVVDVNAEIERLSAHNNNKMIGMLGNFSPQATQKALNDQDKWPQWVKDSFKTESYLGTSVYNWDTKENHYNNGYFPPHLDMSGIARPLAVTNGNMLIGDTVDIVKSMVSAAKGASSSLADIPEYALIANQMDSYGVYAIVISKTMVANQYFKMLVPIQSPLTLGFGEGKDKKGNYTAVVAVFQNNDLAKDNVNFFKELWGKYSDKFGKANVFADIQQDGRVLSAKLYDLNNSLDLEWINIANAYNK